MTRLAITEKMSVRETSKTRNGETKNDMKGANDFDFLIGDWRVHHRRLKERLAGNHDWIEFEGT